MNIRFSVYAPIVLLGFVLLLSGCGHLSGLSRGDGPCYADNDCINQAMKKSFQYTGDRISVPWQRVEEDGYTGRIRKHYGLVNVVREFGHPNGEHCRVLQYSVFEKGVLLFGGQQAQNIVCLRRDGSLDIKDNGAQKRSGALPDYQAPPYYR